MELKVLSMFMAGLLVPNPSVPGDRGRNGLGPLPPLTVLLPSGVVMLSEKLFFSGYSVFSLLYSIRTIGLLAWRGKTGFSWLQA